MLLHLELAFVVLISTVVLTPNVEGFEMLQTGQVLTTLIISNNKLTTADDIRHVLELPKLQVGLLVVVRAFQPVAPFAFATPQTTHSPTSLHLSHLRPAINLFPSSSPQDARRAAQQHR